MARKIILWSITSNNSFICSAGGLRGFSLNFLTLKHLLLFLGITQQSTNRWIWWCQKIASSQSSSSLSRSRPTHAKRGGPSLTHRPSNCNPAISIASVPRQRWVPNRGKQTAAPLSSKRGTDRTELSHSARRLPPQRHRVRALRPNKDATIVCVIGCQITRTRIHHNLKRLASARHDK